MRKSKTIFVGDREVVVNELTMTQIDQLLSGFSDDRAPHRAELLIDSPIPVDVVIAATGLTSEDLAGDIAPSQLQEIWSAVGEVNDFLSRLLEKMVQVGRTIQRDSDG